MSFTKVFKINLEEVKKQLVVVAKLVKSEWDLIDQQIPILDEMVEKLEAILKEN